MPGSAEAIEELYFDENGTFHQSAATPAGASVAPSADCKTITITGGNWNDWSLYGCYDSPVLRDRIMNGYTLILNDIRGVAYDGYGLYGFNHGGSTELYRFIASNNRLIIKGGTLSGDPGSIIAATRIYSYDGIVDNNHTLLDGCSVPTQTSVYGGYLIGGGTVSNNVIEVNNVDGAGKLKVVGGYLDVAADYGVAVTGNQVVLRNSTVANVYGGLWNMDFLHIIPATDNVVTLINSTVTGDVYGGFAYTSYVFPTDTDNVTGNTLNLYGQNRVYAIGNVETINIKDATWGLTTPTLAMDGQIAQNASTAGMSYPVINTENIVLDRGVEGASTLLIQSGVPDAYTTDAAAYLTGNTYWIGTTRTGSGHAWRDAATNSLMYSIDTMGAQDQTHNVVMGAEANMALLLHGYDHILDATKAIGDTANTGKDGIASFAQFRGGKLRQETGSHVDVNSWNAIIALGHKNEKEKSSFEYGAFFEHGNGNYTTHGDAIHRGDGSMRYTGGGALTKWRRRDGLYVEGSFRAGTMKDDARNTLWDPYGVPHSYDTEVPYFGAHLGVGKEIALANGDTVDVYGRYIFNRRNGVSFDAGGRYDIDPVTSQILRVGALYTMKRDTWNFYGGLAYEHEMDGKANGRADGYAIRAADISGGSFRAELGATAQPDQNIPLTLDLKLTGFAGKKQGIFGSVSATWEF